jgi:hypothetical protein
MRGVTVVVASLALAGLAGCATRGNLTNATENLEDNANVLVRDEVGHSDSRVARRDFGPVSDSYRAVERELGLYPDRDEYLPPT